MKMGAHLMSTEALPAHCGRCDRTILKAHDRGLPVRVEVDPIEPAAEAPLILAGYATYDRTRGGHLILRMAHSIAAGRRDRTVHVEHRCVDRGR